MTLMWTRARAGARPQCARGARGRERSVCGRPHAAARRRAASAQCSPARVGQQTQAGRAPHRHCRSHRRQQRPQAQACCSTRSLLRASYDFRASYRVGANAVCSVPCAQAPSSRLSSSRSSSLVVSTLGRRIVWMVLLLLLCYSTMCRTQRTRYFANLCSFRPRVSNARTSKRDKERAHSDQRPRCSFCFNFTEGSN